MITQTAKIRNGSIALPMRLRRIWEEVDVLIKGSGDRIIIERPKVKERIFDKGIERKLQALGKKITKKDIEDAVKWAREQSK